MADTEHLAAQGVVSGGKDTKPDRARTLALAAIDEAFQDHIKELYVLLHKARIDGDTQYRAAQEHTKNGLAFAIITWSDMRLMIPAEPAKAADGTQEP